MSEAEFPDLSGFEDLRVALLGRLDDAVLHDFESMYEAGEWNLAVEWISDYIHDAELPLTKSERQTLRKLGLRFKVDRESWQELVDQGGELDAPSDGRPGT